MFVTRSSHWFVQSDGSRLGNLMWAGQQQSDDPEPMQRRTTIVTNGYDDGPGSLRQAIATAAAGDTIIFAPIVQEIILTSTALVIDKDLTINGGTGISIRRADWAQHFRIFDIIKPATNVTLEKLTIANGSMMDGDGGGVRSNMCGTLTIIASIFSNNTADFGGGLYNRNGTVCVIDSTISDNRATRYGGGVFNFSGNEMIILDSTLKDNTATIFGGGIENNGGIVIIVNSTLEGNTATIFGGGGIRNINKATLTVTNSALSHNTAEYSGGGIFNFADSTVIVENTIVASNTARYDADIAGCVIAKGRTN